jgi:D-beta-D-heptose 7-phosphate kinase/D-beta-D-heptose 1-phosphate adenosyltransferase
VTIFATKDLERLIEAIRPDILTKGSNYTNQTVMGRKIVERLGGRVAMIPVTEGISSTQVINQIKQGEAAD